MSSGSNRIIKGKYIYPTEGPPCCNRDCAATKPLGEIRLLTRAHWQGSVEVGMVRVLDFTFLAGLTLSATGQEPTPPKPPAGDRLLVCNKAEHTVSIFAVAERRELAVLTTGHGPHEVAVSPDGCTAVVTNYGDQQPGHTLTVIDVVGAKVLRTVELAQSTGTATASIKKFLRPHGVQFVGEHQVIVTSESARQLVQVDVRSGTIERTWSSPQQSMHMVAVTKDGRRGAASSLVDGNIVFFDRSETSATSLVPIATAKGAEGIAVHGITGDAWVGNRSDNTLSIVSAQTHEVIQTLPTGDAPFRIVFAPDQRLALVTCTDSGELQIFDAERQQLLREVSVHGDRSEQSSLPLGVACGADQRFAYVTCARGEFVAIIAIATGQFVDRIDARKGPDGIAYARPHRSAANMPATKR